MLASKLGTCGNTAVTAKLQDRLTGALIGLAREVKADERRADVDALILKSLFATVTNVNFDDDDLVEMINEVTALKIAVVTGDVPADYDMQTL